MTARPPRNRGVFMIDEERLSRLLRLPPGQRIIGFEPRFLTLSIAVHLEGDGLPEAAESSEPMTVAGGAFRTDVWSIGATDPAVIHVEVLAALDSPDRLETVESLEGRRRILTRHAPVEHSGAPYCSRCALTPGDPDPWPCDDYRDAVAGVADVHAWQRLANTTTEGDQR